MYVCKPYSCLHTCVYVHDYLYSLRVWWSDEPCTLAYIAEPLGCLCQLEIRWRNVSMSKRLSGLRYAPRHHSVIILNRVFHHVSFSINSSRAHALQCIMELRPPLDYTPWRETSAIRISFPYAWLPSGTSEVCSLRLWFYLPVGINNLYDQLSLHQNKIKCSCFYVFHM